MIVTSSPRSFWESSGLFRIWVDRSSEEAIAPMTAPTNSSCRSGLAEMSNELFCACCCMGLAVFEPVLAQPRQLARRPWDVHNDALLGLPPFHSSQYPLCCGTTGEASGTVRPVPNHGNQRRSVGGDCGGDDHAHVVLRKPLLPGADYRAHTGVVLRGSAQFIREVMSERDHRLGIWVGHPVL